MKITEQYKAEENTSTNSDPTKWKGNIEIIGNYEEVELFKKMFSKLFRGGDK